MSSSLNKDGRGLIFLPPPLIGGVKENIMVAVAERRPEIAQGYEPFYVTGETLKRMKEKLALLEQQLSGFPAALQREGPHKPDEPNTSRNSLNMHRGFAELRRDALNLQIKGAVVVNSPDFEFKIHDRKRIGPGARVTVQNLYGKTTSYDILNKTDLVTLIPEERNTSEAKIEIATPQSPLGQALSGKKPGDNIVVNPNEGSSYPLQVVGFKWLKDLASEDSESPSAAAQEAKG